MLDNGPGTDIRVWGTTYSKMRDEGMCCLTVGLRQVPSWPSPLHVMRLLFADILPQLELQGVVELVPGSKCLPR